MAYNNKHLFAHKCIYNSGSVLRRQLVSAPCGASWGGSMWRLCLKMAHWQGWLCRAIKLWEWGWEGWWLEFLPCRPLQVTVRALSLHGNWLPRERKQKLPEYFNAWAQKSQNVISSILFGQSRNRPSPDSRGGQISSNSRWQQWYAYTKWWSYLRPCLKTSSHHPPYGHNNTFPSHVKNTRFPSLRISK